VLAQRDVEITVTVVDDGSAEVRAVPSLIGALGDSRLRLVRHDRPCGVSAARNSGIVSSSSEWLAFCDDDDVWAPEKLKAQLTSARSGSAGWAYTGDVAVDDELRVVSGAPPLAPGELVEELEHYNPVPAGSSNVMVRRSVLQTVGMFDPTLRSVGDWDLWVRLGRHGPPACVLEPLVGCRVHGNTITRNRHLMLAEVDIVATRHRLPVDRARHFRWAAWNSMMDGCRLEALGHYARAIQQGDVASIGRAAVALLYPGIARRRAQPVDSWARDAQTWLDALRTASPDDGDRAHGEQSAVSGKIVAPRS
jgi:glycosyltransferase involved in cell wall biosynthesis